MSPSFRAALLPWVLLSAVLLLACSDGISPGRACTDIGCASGLRVEVLNLEADSAEVAVQVLGHPEWVVTCERERCEAGVFFPAFTPDYVVVRVRTDQGDFEESFRPEYEARQPNGSGCEPICYNAAVSVDVATGH